MIVKVRRNDVVYKVVFKWSHGFLDLHVHDPKYLFGILSSDTYFEMGVNLAYSQDKSPSVKIDMYSEDYYVNLAEYTVDMYLKDKQKQKEQKLMEENKIQRVRNYNKDVTKLT